jgi:hypothetical protein
MAGAVSKPLMVSVTAMLLALSLPVCARNVSGAEPDASATLRAAVANALEEPSEQEMALRRRQYATVFAVAGGVMFALLIAALWLRMRAAAGTALAAMGTVGIGAMLQFSATKGVPAFLWPPPQLWLGTFAGDFATAVLCAAVAGVLLRPGYRRVLGSILIAEAVWWVIPQAAGAAGLTLNDAGPGMSAGGLMLMGTLVGAVAAPVAAWAMASLATGLAEKIVPEPT